jgi:hypothetical protein
MGKPDVAAAIQPFLDHEYQRGLDDGLKVAEKIVGWLTRKPDTAWQKQVREWAETEIRKARESHAD